jgi:hypothetical protein
MEEVTNILLIKSFRCKEERRLKELQQLEKVGFDYEGFQYQQRLANLAPKRVPMIQSRRGTNATGVRDPERPEMDTKNTIEDSDEDSSDSEGGESIRKKKKRETQLANIRRYRDKTVIIKGKVEMGKPIKEEEFWLEKPPKNYKNSLPITKEIDKFWLGYMDKKPEQQEYKLKHRKDSEQSNQNDDQSLTKTHATSIKPEETPNDEKMTEDTPQGTIRKELLFTTEGDQLLSPDTQRNLNEENLWIEKEKEEGADEFEKIERKDSEEEL